MKTLREIYEEQAANYYNAACSGEGIVGRIDDFPSYDEWLAQRSDSQ